MQIIATRSHIKSGTRISAINGKDTNCTFIDFLPVVMILPSAHKVTKALSEGWVLYGSPSISTGADGKTVCGQAVTKDVGDQTYDPDKKLTAY